MQGLVNSFTRMALKTPGVAKGIGQRLILLHVVGRKTGKHYDIPIAYMEHDGKVLVGSPFGWVKNLHTGDELDVHLKGERRTTDVEVVADEDRVVELFRLMCRDNHAFAKFNNIHLDDKGEPAADDLHAAYGYGARAILLTPHDGG
jgi:deazaflavin-dependent oxidoreductase (nitroreductase family)